MNVCMYVCNECMYVCKDRQIGKYMIYIPDQMDRQHTSAYPWASR